VEPCDILTLKNASVKYVYCVTERAICSLVTLVLDWRTFGTRAQNGTRYSLLSLFLFLLPDQRLYIVNNICIYTHIDCVQTVYELPLLPNDTAVKHFYTVRSGAKC